MLIVDLSKKMYQRIIVLFCFQMLRISPIKIREKI